MAQVTSKCFCSVPLCSNSKQKQPYLSFHSFPADEELRKKWLIAIRRSEGPNFQVIRNSTHVCSAHFEPQDIYVTAKGKTWLKKGAIPRRFSWTRPARQSVYSRVKSRLGDSAPLDEEGAMVERAVCEMEVEGEVSAAVWDHEYVTRPPPGAVEELLGKIKALEEQLERLTVIRTQFSRFCVSDDNFKYYTKFPSEQHFIVFWRSIEPSASRLVYWSKAQKMGKEAAANATPSPSRKLQLIDEFFMYSLRTAVGLKEKVLADMFEVSLSSVSRVIITWANYLYAVLGSVPIWMTREQVRRHLPSKFQKYCPNVRVILDCTELRCESPNAITLHCETFSTYKSHTTFKGLIGVSPSGVVTFVSRLFTGAISDKEITRLSGIIDLLEEGDEVMADKGFLIENLLSVAGAKLIIPPFKHKAQFTKEETEQTQAIARLRILVERVIRRVKEFHIFDSVIPLTLAGSINQIWVNCCLLVIYQGPMELEQH
ncbi:uncharacterized protein LOC143509219 [Brachyhypopomus gauderio]|uniref:uncharacterized protein LOC143509219 n=1 Tax=Brachyhypopomus gauderio TaxID=698409 RepID=UPI0040415C0E